VNSLAIEPDFAMIGHDGAAECLDQGGLAGTVVANDAEDFARIEIKVGVVEGDNGPVFLGQAAGQENGFL
jgi:hypothetical protein